MHIGYATATTRQEAYEEKRRMWNLFLKKFETIDFKKNISGVKSNHKKKKKIHWWECLFVGVVNVIKTPNEKKPRDSRSFLTFSIFSHGNWEKNRDGGGISVSG